MLVTHEREFLHLAQLPNPAREVEMAKAEVRSGLRYLITHPWREIALIPPTIGYLFEHGHWALTFSKSLVATRERRNVDPLQS